jgi:hypothetical protein
MKGSSYSTTNGLIKISRNLPVKANPLWDILRRLNRLEKYCSLPSASAASDASQTTPVNDDSLQIVPPAIQNLIKCIKDEDTRYFLVLNLFCRLRQIHSTFFSSRAISAITSAISEIEFLQNTPSLELLEDPVIQKDLVKRLIESKYPPNNSCPHSDHFQTTMAVTNSKASNTLSRKISWLQFPT